MPSQSRRRAAGPSRRHVLGSCLALPALARAARVAAPGAPGAPGAQEDPAHRPGRTPNTRFAVNVEIWWSSLPLLERIRKAAELGFPAIEFWPWRGKDLAAIAALCGELGLEVAQFTAWGFEPGMNDPAHHDEVEREIAAACEAARTLGARLMTVVAGNDQPGMTTEEMHANVVTALRRVAPLAEAAGVTLILEPMNGRVDHPGHCLYGSEAGVRICRAVDSPSVKLNWDLYHMQLAEGDLCGHLREGFDQLGYVQAADAPGRHEPGTGEIHWPRVLRELHELGYRGLVGLECWPVDGELEAARTVNAVDRW